MLKNLLQKLENPELPLLGPNVLALQIFGLLLPKTVFKRGVYIFIHVFVAIFSITECIDIWYVKSDINLLLNNIKVTIPAFNIVFKDITFLIWHNRWETIIEYVTAADKKQRNSDNEVKRKIIDHYTKYCRRLTYICGGVTLTTVGIMISAPVLKYFSSPDYRLNVRNGTETYLEVVSSWMPFDKTSIYGYLAASVIQTGTLIFGSAWIIAYDTTALTIMVFFHGELEMLRKDCTFIFGTVTQKLNDEDVMERIKECRKRHLELVKAARLLNSCMSPSMLLYVIICSMMLCVSAYQINIETNFVQKIILTEYLIYGIAELFLFCWHSNNVLYMSRNLMLGPYESTWWAGNLNLRKELYILTAQFGQTIVFTAGPFTDLCLPSFITILKGAYSYYTLLSQSQMK